MSFLNQTAVASSCILSMLVMLLLTKIRLARFKNNIRIPQLLACLVDMQS
jgi:hypothetical protein